MSGSRKDDIYNEGALRIMEALGAADEELLERCGMPPEPAEVTEKVADISKYGKRHRKPLWRMGRTWAACLGLLLIGAISWYGLRVIAPKGTSNDSARDMSGGAMDASYNTSVAPETAFMEGEQEEAAVDGIAEGMADAGAEKNPEDSADTRRGGEPGEMEQQSAESKVTSDREELMADRGNGDNSGIIAGTEEDARGWLPLGAYLPQDLPKGYRLESAFINPERQSVTMTWLRGMDYITVSILSVEPGTVKTVDISKPETYDERLYEVPYAETVPREYWETMNDPVFDFSDMDSDTGLELVSSRMISHNDAGDMDTPRGIFSVLIEDDVLLHFNGRGTPEEIWDLICSIER